MATRAALLVNPSLVFGGRDISASTLGRALLRVAAHDWLLLTYLVVIVGLTVARRGESALPIALAVFDLAWLLAVLFVVRGQGSKTKLVSSIYRLSLVTIPLVSYLQLRWILPVVAPGSADAELLAFDLRVFRYEPSLAWDPLVTPQVTEWFSFFYYSYFVLLAVHAFPIALFAEDGRLLREFAFGVLVLFCVGHLLYVLVPAVGPYAYPLTAAMFARPLEGPLFWPLVEDAVRAAGARRDIFPSLHTAVPVFLTIYAFRHRHRLAFRFTWPVLGFFASQIILATMYLRWHYLVDILAGVLLATTAALLSRPIARWEARRRIRAAVAPTFPPPLALRMRARG